MNTFTQYAIGEKDIFDEHRFPLVVDEIDGLQGRLCEIHGANKVNIIISLLKDHSVKTEWLVDNKQLAWMLTSGFVSTSHVEALFNSCKTNLIFLSGLEAYITSRLG